ncbi:MAG: hypothetical protein PSX71_03925 [bacterium]|nr:hypothetical protein [bacterium]
MLGFLSRYVPSWRMSRCTGLINDYRPVISIVAYFFVLCFCFRYGQEIMRGGDAWKTGDWLINYEGGPVRRGLVGQVLYEFSRLGTNLLWSAFVLQVAIYLLVAHLTLKLFFSVDREASWLLLIFSPAFIFLFPFYDVQGGFRKEIILFLSFCVLACGLLDGKLRHGHVIASLLIYGVAVFSHELAAFAIFFMVFLLLQAKTNTANHAMINAYAVGYILLAVGGVGFALANPGNGVVKSEVCNSLLMAGLKDSICSGAIEWLQFDSGYGMREVRSYLSGYLVVYPLLFFLACFPVFLTGWYRKRVIFLMLGFFSLLPLFVVAVDWGRWIHVYVFMVSITLLLESSNATVMIGKFPVLGLLAYMGLWSIPHCCTARPGLGMIDVAYLALRKLVF